jgi:hypothetical protein
MNAQESMTEKIAQECVAWADEWNASENMRYHRFIFPESVDDLIDRMRRLFITNGHTQKLVGYVDKLPDAPSVDGSVNVTIYGKPFDENAVALFNR